MEIFLDKAIDHNQLINFEDENYLIVLKPFTFPQTLVIVVISIVMSLITSICMLSMLTLTVDSLKCLVTEFNPITNPVTNEVTIDNGTFWKWWPVSEAGKAELKECDDSWTVCASRHIRPTMDPCDINPTLPSCQNRTIPCISGYDPNCTTTTAPTTTRTPNECIACGKSTWRRIGVGMEEGDVFVSMGCYGSEMAEEIEQKSCSYEPNAGECQSPGESDLVRPPQVGGHICSQCFCEEDGCNGSTNLFLTNGGLFGILFLRWVH